MKRFNDSIEEVVDRPLHGAEILRTESGFYKIIFEDVKWYEGYKDVNNFMKALNRLDEQDIPYKFIRLGEDIEDIEVKENYTDDMPDELCEFSPEVSIYDSSAGNYEVVHE